MQDKAALNMRVGRGLATWLTFRIVFAVLIALGPITAAPLAAAEPEAVEEEESPIEPQRFQIGVQSTEGATRVLEAWKPTIELLNSSAKAQDIPYSFQVAPYTVERLNDAIDDGEVDFILIDPAGFVATEVENRARAILSVAHMWQGQSIDRAGATVFTRSDSSIRRFEDLEGRKVMAVDRNDFAGWRLAEQEMRKHRLEPREILTDLVFSGGNQREVIYAVRAGLVDAGVVRTGVMEALAAQGVIDLVDFAPVQMRLHKGFPFLASTSLYPGWVMAALPDVPEPALAMLINTLLTISPDSPEATAASGAVWQAPQNYQEVHDLLISLRARPYESYLLQAAYRIWDSYRWPILSISLLIVFSLLFLLYQVRRNLRIREEQRNVLQSEQKSKQFYRNAIEEHTVFCMLTVDGRISHVNEHFCKVAQRIRANLHGRSLLELLTETEGNMFKEEISAAMQFGAPWTGSLRVQREDGSVAWVECSFIPITGAEDRLTEIAVVASDMTKTQEGIAEAKFRDSLELVDDQVVVLRPETLEILYCNRAAFERLVKDRVGGDWVGKFASDLITTKDYGALRTRCEELMEGPQRRITWEAAIPDRTPYEISLEYVQPEQEEPRFIAIYRDITQRKQAERAKNEFISTVSHELRTPLTSMKGALGLALSGALGDIPPQMNKMVTMASSNCDRLILLINDILDLEKIEAGKMDFNMEKVDLVEMVESSIESNRFYADKYGVTIRLTETDPEVEYAIMGDRNRLLQVMDNLLSNASKFSHEGDVIDVTLEFVKDRLRMSVRDYGFGIPEKSQATIFEKFTQADSSDTRKKGGTGLGLSIAKLIAESHDGTLSFVSVEGSGTDFFMDLPRLLNGQVVPFDPTINANADQLQQFQAGRSHVDENASLEDGNDNQDMNLRILMGLLSQDGIESKLESGRVKVSQVVSGKGVIGQSTVLNWLTDDGRTLISDLFARNVIGNSPVAVMKSSQPGTIMQTLESVAQNNAASIGDWLAQLLQSKIGQETASENTAAFRLLLVGDIDMPDFNKSDVDIMRAADTPQAIVLSNEENFDMVVRHEKIGQANCTTIMPTKGSELESTTPIMVVVSQLEAAEGERGVVSKFSRSSGVGRGKARRSAGRG